MSETKQNSRDNVDLVLANTVSRLGCTVAQAREHLAKQATKKLNLTPAPKPAQPTSKGGTVDGDEALL